MQVWQHLKRCVHSMSTSSKNTAILVDGNNLLYSCYRQRVPSHHPILSALTPALAQPALNFLHHLQHYVIKYEPEALYVFFDTSPQQGVGKANPRKLAAHLEYKADRKPTPKALRPQFKLLQDLLSTMTVMQPGVEADDLIASVATTLCQEQHVHVTIVSDDIDFFQLIQDPVSNDEDCRRDLKTDEHLALPRILDNNEKALSSSTSLTYQELRAQLGLGEGSVAQYRPLNKQTVVAKRVRGRFGVKPSRFADYQALRCHKLQTSRGTLRPILSLGPGDIHTLLSKCSSIPNLLQNLESLDVRASVRERLMQHISVVELSYRLSKLDSQLPIARDIIEHQEGAHGHTTKVKKESIAQFMRSIQEPENWTNALTRHGLVSSKEKI